MNLDDFNIKDEFLINLKNLQFNREIKILILSNNLITNFGILKISEIIQNSNIQTIDLSGNLITEKSLKNFEILIKNNKNIKNIICENCSLEKTVTLEF